MKRPFDIYSTLTLNNFSHHNNVPFKRAKVFPSRSAPGDSLLVTAGSVLPNPNIYEQLELRRTGCCTEVSIPSETRSNFQMTSLSHVSHYPVDLDSLSPCENLNKIFASSWWDDNEVLFGTKGNRICRLDVDKMKLTFVPTLKGADTLPSFDDYGSSACGIHCIEPSPNKLAVATGGYNVNSVAVYKLPNFEPLCVLEKGHDNWLFDVCWADNECLFSCGRDGAVCGWNLASLSYFSTTTGSSSTPSLACIQQPTERLCLDTTLKLRSMDRILGTSTVLVAAMNKSIYSFDIQRPANTWEQYCKFVGFTDTSFSSTFVKAHPHRPFMFAVGCHKGFRLGDMREKIHNIIPTPSRGVHYLSAIRTMDFYDNVFSYGTTLGSLSLMDLRTYRYLDTHYKPPFDCMPGVAEGELNFSCLRENYTNELGDDNHFVIKYYSALYCHSIAPDGYRIFCGGGPIPISCQGNVACIWQ